MMFCIADFEAQAKEVLHKHAWDYYSSGAVHQQTLRDNVEAYNRYRLRPRVLRDVSKLDMSVSLLGEKVSFPVCVSPTACHGMAHHEGELATARACSKLGTCMALSTWSNNSIEMVAETSGSGLRWFQIYIFKDRGVTKNFALRAEAAGYKALVLTVDSPVLGRRLVDKRNSFNLPAHISLANFTNTSAQSALTVTRPELTVHHYTMGLVDKQVTWRDVDWLCSLTKLPVVLKGILTAEDAREAVKHNIQGIIVSNHGARQLDGVPATIDALREVVEAVEGRVEVYMDGGVRQGTDVLKALAMGARAVFVGRPVVWGLACKGSEGVEEVLGILREEFRVAMMLSGCAKLSNIEPEMVVHESYYKIPKSRM